MWAPVQSRCISCSAFSSKNKENYTYIQDKASDDWDTLEDFCQNSDFYKSKVPTDLEYDSTRDRFGDVLPLPSSTAIRLKSHGMKQPFDSTSHYMNANVIHGNTFRYIASQSPTPATMANFWKMVSEQNVLLLVMLVDDTNDVIPYWPTKGENPQYEEMKKNGIHKIKNRDSNNFKLVFENNDLEVELKKTIRINKSFSSIDNRKMETGIVIRSIVLRNMESMKERTIAHIQYKKWPDHGVPSPNMFPEVKFLYETLYKYLYTINKSQKITVLFHCRAGIGRTGTFIAIDQLIHQVGLQLTNYSKGNNIDIFNVVLNLRLQRKGLVQTKEQYLFIYKFMRYLMMNGMIEGFVVKYTRNQVKLDTIAKLDSSSDSQDDSD